MEATGLESRIWSRWLNGQMKEQQCGDWTKLRPLGQSGDIRLLVPQTHAPRNQMIGGWDTTKAMLVLGFKPGKTKD